MEKTHSHNSSTVDTSVIYLLVFSLSTVSLAAAAAPPILIKVGVVVNMNNYIGQMAVNCISIAVSDLYAANPHYKTRLQIYFRDSKGDAVGAAAAVVDLLKNVEVEAIIGPLTSLQANFMINLGDKAQVPIITFSATTPSLSSIQTPYFIRATLSDYYQVRAIAAVVKAFGWREITPIYMDNQFGEGIIPFLTEALEQANAHVHYRSVIPSLATDDHIAAELYKLMSMQTRVFVVHLFAGLGSRLFAKAKQLGMLSENYVWIATDGIANELSSLDRAVMESMQGVIAVRPYVPHSKDLQEFTLRYKRRLQQSNPTAVNPDLNIYGLWAYDSATALAMAAEKARLTSNATPRKTNTPANSTDLEAFGVSVDGPRLIRALSRTAFRGLAGDFRLADGQLQPPPYQIVNLVGPGARVIGYWRKENGIVKELSFKNEDNITYSTSRNNLRSIIWPGDRTSPPKGWVIPADGKRLRVGVPVKDGFAEFVRFTWNPDNSTQVEGYCIDVFDAVMAALPVGVPYEYVPFATPDRRNAGTHNDLAYQVFLGNFDAVAGDVTIVANRSQFVDFTLPFTESGVSMVVPVRDYKKRTAWVFLKPLTWQLWLTSFCSFLFMGFLIWILEHRINEDFRGPPSHQIGMIFWFSFSTMVFAHKERVMSNLARFVLIIWFLVVLILTQSYTASLTSMLTVEQLQPTVTDVNELIRNKENVGYQEGSFVYGQLKRMNFDESRLVEYNSAEECHELFSKGSSNGGIAAAFDEIPYIELFLAKYCSKYTMVGPTYKTDGFAFVFPIGSPLVPDVSRAILNITEGEKMGQIEKKWLGGRNKCVEATNLLLPNSLGLESFWGLFLLVGIAAFSVIFIYVVMFLHEHWHVVTNSNQESSILSKIILLLQRFDSRDLSSHTFRNGYLKERNCGDGEAEERVIGSPQNLQESSYCFSPTFLQTNTPASAVFSDYADQNTEFSRERGGSVESPQRITRREGSTEVIRLEISLANPNGDRGRY